MVKMTIQVANWKHVCVRTIFEVIGAAIAHALDTRKGYEIDDLRWYHYEDKESGVELEISWF